MVKKNTKWPISSHTGEPLADERTWCLGKDIPLQKTPGSLR